MLQLVAFVIPLHDSVDDWPLVIVVGLALKLPMAAAGGAGATTVIVAVWLPPDVVIVSVCVPIDVTGSSDSVIVRVVAVPVTSGRETMPACAELDAVTDPIVTPDPLTVTVVAPGTNGPPVAVTTVVVPAVSVDGISVVTVGVAGLTVSVCPPLVPPLVVTVTVCAPRSAALSTLKLAVRLVPLATVTPLTLTPAPLTATVAPARKFVPVSVSLIVLPAIAVAGLRLASVGAAAVTVNVPPLVVPPAVVTVTVRAPSVALPLTDSCAVAVVGLCTVTLTTTTPSPLTVTFVPPAMKLDPVTVTARLVPCVALAGDTAFRPGAEGAVGDWLQANADAATTADSAIKPDR
jgi:hypothetical protein